MSIVITNKELTKELEEKILKEVVVEKKDNFSKNYYKQQVRVKPYRIFGAKLFMPFAWALENIPSVSRRQREEFKVIDYKFNLELRDIQKEIKTDCIKALNEKGCHLISLFPGAGKTNLSIFLSTKIKLRTLIICHRLILIEQWEAALKGCITKNPGGESPSVKVITTKLLEKKLQGAIEPDYLLVNAQNIPKLGGDIFKNVGLCIVDEAHLIVAENLSICLSYISPRYLLFLTATPTRPDGLDSLFDFYIGKNNRTVRELHHPHLVYKIQTEYTYEESSDQWTALITSQSMNDHRNEYIVKALSKFLNEEDKDDERCVLIMCKRVDQVKHLHKLLEPDYKVSSLSGSNNDYDKDSKIVIGVFSKVGVGFSFDRLNTLVLASDIISKDSEDYMIQYLARIMRHSSSKAIVLDFVDDHPILKAHFNVRKKQYLKAGGKIINYNL